MNDKTEITDAADKADNQNKPFHEMFLTGDQIDTLLAVSSFGFPWAPSAKNALGVLSLVRDRFRPERKPNPVCESSEDSEKGNDNPIVHQITTRTFSKRPEDQYSEIKSMWFSYQILDRKTKTVFSVEYDSKRRSFIRCEMHRCMAVGDSDGEDSHVPLYDEDFNFNKKTLAVALDRFLSVWKEKDAESDLDEHAADTFLDVF